MRSFYTFVQAPEEAISTWLDSIAQRTPNTRQWICPDPDKRSMYIELADDLYDELEPETKRSLLDHFNGEQPRSICVDVSRHHSAEHEIKELAAAILRQFGGVAMDDESDHCWTIDEIEADQMVQGRRFFGRPGAA